MKKLLAFCLLFGSFASLAEFDRTDPADLLALKTEVNDDPLGLGYDAVSGSTTTVLTAINAKDAQFTVSKPKISAADVRATCTYDAYNNLAIDEQEWIQWMTGSNGSGEESLIVTADLRLQLTDAEGSGTNSIWAVADRTEMNTAMLALMDVAGSRAEDLFGYGTNISRTDWLAARDYQ